MAFTQPDCISVQALTEDTNRLLQALNPKAEEAWESMVCIYLEEARHSLEYALNIIKEVSGASTPKG